MNRDPLVVGEGHRLLSGYHLALPLPQQTPPNLHEPPKIPSSSPSRVRTSTSAVLLPRPDTLTGQRPRSLPRTFRGRRPRNRGGRGFLRLPLRRKGPDGHPENRRRRRVIRRPDAGGAVLGGRVHRGPRRSIRPRSLPACRMLRPGSASYQSSGVLSGSRGRSSGAARRFARQGEWGVVSSFSRLPTPQGSGATASRRSGSSCGGAPPRGA